MARGKNTPALFEVIRNAQQKQKDQLERDRLRQEQHAAAEAGGVSPAAQLLRSPVYWFKGKHAHAAATGLDGPVMREAAVSVPPYPAILPPQAQVAAPAEKATPTPVMLPVISKAAPDVTRPVSVDVARPPAAPVVVPAAPIVTVLPQPPAYPSPDLSVAEAARPQVRADAYAQEAPAAEPLFHTPSAYDGFDDAFDSGVYGEATGLPDDAATPTDEGAVTFSYTAAIVSAFAVVVAFAVAYVAFHAGPKSSKALADKQTRPDVLNVQTTPAVITSPSAPPEDDTRASVGSDEQTLALQSLGKPVPVPTDVKRVIGQQYLVLLSFPNPDDAKDLVKYLALNGVPTTAETALPGYAKSWTSVVTVRGFDRTKNNPAYTKYVAALDALKQNYAGNSKFRKTFKTDVYTWRAAR